MFRAHPARLIFVLFVFLFLTLAFVPFISIDGVGPDLFFIFLVFYAFHISWKTVPIPAFLIGLAKDILTNSYFGLETFSLVTASILLGLAASKIERDNAWLRYLVTFIFSVTAMSVFSVSFLILEGSPRLIAFSFARVFYVSVYTVFVSPLVFFFLDRLLKVRSRQYELFS